MMHMRVTIRGIKMMMMRRGQEEEEEEEEEEEDVYIFLYLRKAHCSPLSDTSYRNSSLQYTTINLDLKPLATQKISQIWLFCVREILSSLQDIWSAERKVIDFVSIFGPFLHSLHFEQLFIHFFLQSFDRDVGLCET